MMIRFLTFVVISLNVAGCQVPEATEDDAEDLAQNSPELAKFLSEDVTFQDGHAEQEVNGEITVYLYNTATGSCQSPGRNAPDYVEVTFRLPAQTAPGFVAILSPGIQLSYYQNDEVVEQETVNGNFNLELRDLNWLQGELTLSQGAGSVTPLYLTICP